MSSYDFKKGRKLSPLKSIKAYCKEQCCAGDLESWRNCTFEACLLWRYRLGKGNKSLRQKEASILSNSTKEEHCEGGQS